MRIQSQIDRIAANVAAALEAIAAKGVTVPEGANSDNLAELIALIRHIPRTAVLGSSVVGYMELGRGE